MKAIIPIMVLVQSVAAFGMSPSRKLYCKDNKTKSFLAEVNITKGEIVLTDVASKRQLDKFVGLDVKIKNVGNQDRITIQQDGRYSDIPTTIFKAKVDAYGTGSAESFDDLGKGKTKYTCGIDNLDL